MWMHLPLRRRWSCFPPRAPGSLLTPPPVAPDNNTQNSQKKASIFKYMHHQVHKNITIDVLQIKHLLVGVHNIPWATLTVSHVSGARVPLVVGSWGAVGLCPWPLWCSAPTGVKMELTLHNHMITAWREKNLKSQSTDAHLCFERDLFLRVRECERERDFERDRSGLLDWLEEHFFVSVGARATVWASEHNTASQFFVTKPKQSKRLYLVLLQQQLYTEPLSPFSLHFLAP